MSKVLGLIIILGSLGVLSAFEGSTTSSSTFKALFWPAILLTGVGPLGLMLLCSPWNKVIAAFSLLKKSPSRLENSFYKELGRLNKMAHEFHQLNGRDFVDWQKASSHIAMKKLFGRLALKIPVGDIRQLMTREEIRLKSYHESCIDVMGLGVRFSPSIGMLGTILGMVQLLGNLQDPSEVGRYMSVALLTTFYGLFFSLIVWTPLQNRLEALLKVHQNFFEEVQGLLEILEEQHPGHYFDELQSGLHRSKEKVHTTRPTL